MAHPGTLTPSPWTALRRTRRQLIGVSILLGLWLLLMLCFMRIVAPEIDFDFHSKWGRLDRIFIFTFAGFVLSHAIVGLKLLQLIKASGKPGMESDPREAATAFISNQQHRRNVACYTKSHE